MLTQVFRTIRFPEGATAIAHHPQTMADLNRALMRMDLPTPRPVIVLVGGAANLRHYHLARLHTLFVKVLAPLAEAIGAAVVDGGTDVGVMQMMGYARQKIHGTFPLIGVLPVGVAALPNQLPPCPEAAPLEPNHSHFVLVPGSSWGDECPWIAGIAGALAQGMPSVTVLVNGGEITWMDAAESVKAERPVVAIAGSGRAADALTKALQGETTDLRAHQLVASRLVQSVQLEDTERLATTLHQILSEFPRTSTNRSSPSSRSGGAPVR